MAVRKTMQMPSTRQIMWAPFSPSSRGPDRRQDLPRALASRPAFAGPGSSPTQIVRRAVAARVAPSATEQSRRGERASAAPGEMRAGPHWRRSSRLEGLFAAASGVSPGTCDTPNCCHRTAVRALNRKGPHEHHSGQPSSRSARGPRHRFGARARSRGVMTRPALCTTASSTASRR